MNNLDRYNLLWFLFCQDEPRTLAEDLRLLLQMRKMEQEALRDGVIYIRDGNGWKVAYLDQAVVAAILAEDD
jgi:hypothetical protein